MVLRPDGAFDLSAFLPERQSLGVAVELLLVVEAVVLTSGPKPPNLI